jgi:hypothetical protein
MLKVALVLPAGIVTDEGIVALLLDALSDTETPPEGAPLGIVTVAVDPLVPMVVDGFNVRDSALVFNVRYPVRVIPPS